MDEATTISLTSESKAIITLTETIIIAKNEEVKNSIIRKTNAH
ncbi:hypothetical protein PRLR5025_31880 [Prevotella lacticifex]|nr:hypothetical protein PRLR5025_31880 [Prevotella lacticifex]